MFYSHDLLGRKSPLGAIWTMAHGKKLSKVKILGLNVADICKHILQPEVPHSLRLQGILIGGVAIVFSRQQLYLLEDLQDMLRKVTASKNSEQTAAAVVNTVLQRGRDKARAEAITLQDAGPGVLTLPFNMLGELEDLEDLELLDQHERQGAKATDPEARLGDEDEEDDDEGAGGQRRGRRDAGISGLLAEDLLMLPTLAPPSAADGGSEGAQKARGSSGRDSGSGGAGRENHTHLGFLEDEMFEAPDLQLLINDEDGEALFRTIGGFAVAGAAPPTAAGPSGTAVTTPNHTPAVTGGGAAATNAAGPAAAATLEPLTELPEPHDSFLDFGKTELPPELILLNSLTQTQEQELEQQQQQHCEPEASEGQPAQSLLPLPSVGEPPEHYMPPSPVHDGEEMMPAAMAALASDGAPAGTTSAGTSTDGAAGAGALQRKRRRTSDEDNDSVSEVTGSLLAVTDQLGQLATAGDEDKGNNAPMNGLGEQQVAARQHEPLRSGRAAAIQPTRRRRPGARVTQDDVEAIVVPGRTYREWTLDTSELVRPMQKAAVPTAATTSSVGRTGGAAASTLAGEMVAHCGPLFGRQSGGLYDCTPVARMTAAVALALAAGDTDTACTVVRRVPASMLCGRGMAWAPQLVQHVVTAAEADDVVVDDDEDAGRGDAKAPALRGAAAQLDVPRGKRQRVMKAAAHAEDAQQQAEQLEDGNKPPSPQQQPRVSGGRSHEAVDDDMVSQRSDSRLQAYEGGGVMEGQDALLLEKEELAASEGHPASALFQAPRGAPLPDADDPMGLMQDDQFEVDDVEIERLRREDTPEGSEAERQLQAQKLAALGLASGGRLATGGPSSKGTSGTSGSSMGREDEIQTLANRAAFRRPSVGSPRRFGNGTLEDLLPAINEGDGQAAGMDFMDWEEDQELAADDPAAEAGQPGLSGGRTSAKGRGTHRSAQRGTVGSSVAGTGTTTGTQDADAPFSLKETNGLATQAVAPPALIGRSTQVAISVFRQHLGGGVTARRQLVTEGNGEGRNAEPNLSFFALVSRLKRAEAVKLFYQTLVTNTAGYVRATQDEPYGDIIIRAGIKL